MAETAVNTTDALNTDQPEQVPNPSAESGVNTDGQQDVAADLDEDESVNENAEAEGEPEDNSAAEAPNKRTRPRWFDAAVSVLGVVAIGLAAMSIVFGVQLWQHHHKVEQRQAATSAARHVASQLTSISYKTADQDLQQLRDMSTGKFHNQFAKRMKPFADVLKKAKVVTNGKVVESGVERTGDSSIRVLIATHSEVKNTQAKSSQPRDYRLRITMTRADDRWLASNVEFVS